MGCNYEEMENEINSMLDSAAENADNRLIIKLAAITRFTNEEVKELFPKRSEQNKANELMMIVKSSESKNKKISRIVDNAKEYGEVILKLLQKFV